MLRGGGADPEAGGVVAPVELDVDLVGHAADWRASLAWSVDAWRSWWEQR